MSAASNPCSASASTTRLEDWTQRPKPWPGWPPLVALDASEVSYSCAAEAALDMGATAEEVVGTLIAVAPITGLARLVSATPAVGLLIGYDIDQAFESLDSDTCG